MPAKTGYLYYREVPVVHTDDGAQTNYQMKVLVGESSGATGEKVDCGGYCLSTFNDLWFQGYSDIDQDTIIDLDYWIESITGTTPNQLATVWVEVAYIPAHPTDTVIWMSYGKAGASAASNGEDTFPFFDHFDGDLSKWQGNTDHCSVGSSIVTLTANSSDVHTIYPTGDGLSTDIAVRMRASVSDANYNACAAGNGAFTNYVMLQHNSAIANHSQWGCNDGTYQAIDTDAVGFGAYHIFEFHRIITGTDTAKCFYDNASVGTTTTHVPTSALYPVIMAYANGTAISADWILRRNVTANEPTWGAWGAEQLAVQTASVAVGLTTTALRLVEWTRTATVAAGLSATASRLVEWAVRSASTAIGFLSTATRTATWTRTATVAKGLSVTATKPTKHILTAAVTIGMKITASSYMNLRVAVKTVKLMALRSIYFVIGKRDASSGTSKKDVEIGL